MNNLNDILQTLTDSYLVSSRIHPLVLELPKRDIDDFVKQISPAFLSDEVPLVTVLAVGQKRLAFSAVDGADATKMFQKYYAHFRRRKLHTRRQNSH